MSDFPRAIKVPEAAVFDKRLTDVELRLLGVILAHGFTAGHLLAPRNCEHVATHTGLDVMAFAVAYRNLLRCGHIPGGDVLGFENDAPEAAE